MKIELVKDESRSDPIRSGGYSFLVNRGGYVVNVEGKQWGRITLEYHGCHGATYHLQQKRIGGGFRECHEQMKSLGRGLYAKPFRIWGNKQARHDLEQGETLAPLHDRLTVMIKEAIKKKCLRDPAEIQVEDDKRRAERVASQVTELQQRESNFRQRAHDAIGVYAKLMSASACADLTGRIVEAMKWAENQ